MSPLLKFWYCFGVLAVVSGTKRSGEGLTAGVVAVTVSFLSPSLTTAARGLRSVRLRAPGYMMLVT